MSMLLWLSTQQLDGMPMPVAHTDFLTGQAEFSLLCQLSFSLTCFKMNEKTTGFKNTQAEPAA